MQFKMSAKQSEAWPKIERQIDKERERDREEAKRGKSDSEWAALWLTATQQLIRTLNKPHTCGRTGRMMIGRGLVEGYVVD